MEKQKNSEPVERREDPKSNLPFRPKPNNDPEQSSEEIPNPASKTSPSKKGKMKGNAGATTTSKASQADTVETAEGSSKLPSGQGPKDSLPAFIIKRNKLFDDLKRRRDAEILEKEHPIINVVLDLGLDKNGKARPAMPVAAKAWESTPGSFLRHVDKEITSDVVVAKVDGKQLWDLDRPLEYDCRVSYVPFASAEGRNVFWHSSAHVLGEAAECQYQCLLSHGPPVEQGFFYDMALAEG